MPDWMQHSRVDVSIQDQIKDQIPSIGGVELSSESEEEDEGGAAAPQKRWKPPKAGVRHPSSPLLSLITSVKSLTGRCISLCVDGYRR